MIKQLFKMAANTGDGKVPGAARAPGLWPRLRDVVKSGSKNIRARLVILSVIILVPLMIDHVRVLETMRNERIVDIREDALSLARQSAQRQAEIIENTQALLQSTAHLYEQITLRGGSCENFQKNATFAPWTKTIAVANADGKIICTSEPAVRGINIADRPYFQNALKQDGFALSDYIVARGTNKPVIVAAYAAHIGGSAPDTVVLMSVNLQWLANLRSNVNDNGFASTFLIDQNGMLIASSDDIAGKIGQNFHAHSLVADIVSHREGTATRDDFVGKRRIFAFSQIPGTRIHLAVGIAEAEALAAIDRSIFIAYVQFLLIVVAVMGGAWLAGERMIMRPIKSLARTVSLLGKGNLATRIAPNELAIEFRPLAEAFNDMAAKLAGRESGLLADNNRLTVLASLDTVSGLANRRGFNSRMDFEWMRLAQSEGMLGLMMIDLDHFKQFNDTYGHPEGDACLHSVGTLLGTIANEQAGFAARYGGEEFLLMVPGADLTQMVNIAEHVSERVRGLHIPHSGSPFGQVTVSIGASATRPDTQSAPDILIKSADVGLYAAKRRGRNQVVGHDVIVQVTAPESAENTPPAKVEA